MKSKLITPAIFALIATPWLTQCSREDHHAQVETPEPVAVETTVAESQSIPIYSSSTGTVRSRNKASIAPKVTGQITTIHVNPGQSIEKGELLVEISALEITSKLQSAQASMDKVRRDLMREEDLLASGASTPEIVKDLKDQLRVAEAAVREAQTMLSYTQITAPFEGVITRKHANEGDLALPGNPLLEIEDLNNLRVEADIPEAIAIHLKVGMTVQLELSGSDRSIEGKIEEIAPAAHPVAHTFPIKISLSESAGLKSGQFARVRIPVKEMQAVLVDRRAVSEWGQIERVFIVQDGRLHLQIIKGGSVFGDKLEVLSGLDGGEILVLEPEYGLKDGTPVRE